MTRATPGFLEALAAVASALGEPDSPAMVIGGVAVIAQGVPRLTADVDATIYKVVAARPKDVDDAEALVTLHAGRIDFDRVRRVVSKLAAALDDDERPELLERVIRRARP